MSAPTVATHRKKRPHSLVSHTSLLGKVIAIVTEAGDWLNETDLVTLETTCTQARDYWCSGVWKPLALKTWPHLIVVDDDAARPATSYYFKQLFCNPRLWLHTSAQQIKLLPKWGTVWVHDEDVECGRCGCNGRETDECSICIESEYRWEKKQELGQPHCWMDVPENEGYEMSGRTVIMVNAFCDSCFRRLRDLDIVHLDDYTPIQGAKGTLFDVVTQEIMKPRKHRDTPLFSSRGKVSWQKANKGVKADDVAIVVANALVQENCQTTDLQLEGIQCQFGPIGYKALAFALSINKTLVEIDFYHCDNDHCLCCNDEDAKFSYAADMSKGLFLKALKHNPNSALVELMYLCSSAFGPHTWEAWESVKPGLKGDRELPSERYHDYQKYVEFDKLLGKAITLVAETGDWLDETDLMKLAMTCSDARFFWCHRAWKPLALKKWPHLIDGAAAISESSYQYYRYKHIFCDPQRWLETSAQQIKLIPAWGSELVHYNVECGRCGCNCRNSFECPGVPIESEYRWEKVHKLDWPANRVDVPNGEGYEMSGGTMIMVNAFCDSCFRRLHDLDIVQVDDYTPIRGKTLFDLVTQEIMKPRKHRDTPFFSSQGSFSWQEVNKEVKADDVAIVVANALIQENCQTNELQLDGIHCKFGPIGYKALAFALSINKTLVEIDFFHYDNDHCFCCYDEDAKFSYAADMSNGLFLKALKHNPNSALRCLEYLCSSAFGPGTCKVLETAIPRLKCSSELEDLERYHDYDEYVSFSDFDNSDKRLCDVAHET